MMLINGEKWERSESSVGMPMSRGLNMKKEAIFDSLKSVKSRTSGTFSIKKRKFSNKTKLSAIESWWPHV